MRAWRPVCAIARQEAARFGTPLPVSLGRVRRLGRRLHDVLPGVGWCIAEGEAAGATVRTIANIAVAHTFLRFDPCQTTDTKATLTPTPKRPLKPSGLGRGLVRGPRASPAAEDFQRRRQPRRSRQDPVAQGDRGLLPRRDVERLGFAQRPKRSTSRVLRPARPLVVAVGDSRFCFDASGKDTVDRH